MNNFIQRTLSGIVYVALVVASILLHPAFFGGLFILITFLAVREFHTILSSPKHLTVSASLAAALIYAVDWLHCFAPQYCACQHMAVYIWAGLMLYCLLMLALLVAQLFETRTNPIHNCGNLLASQLMVALPFVLMNHILMFKPLLLLALFITIWINDSGAYCVGSLLAKRPGGNHKMFPRVSPAKSWEGLIGGILFALLAGVVFVALGWIHTLWLALVYTFVIAVAGTFGDLMESLYKRTIGIKDSGRFLPGHGGVLDRFDSILLATPMVFLLIWMRIVLL